VVVRDGADDRLAAVDSVEEEGEAEEAEAGSAAVEEEEEAGSAAEVEADPEEEDSDSVEAGVAEGSETDDRRHYYYCDYYGKNSLLSINSINILLQCIQYTIYVLNSPIYIILYRSGSCTIRIYNEQNEIFVLHA